MKRKILTVLLSLVLCVTLAGCFVTETEGGDNGGGNGGGSTPAAEYIKAGAYEVGGADVKAGEYLLVATGLSQLKVMTEKDAGIMSDAMLLYATFTKTRYVELTDGQFVEFSSAKMYALKDAPVAEKQSDNGYNAGHLKEGRDIEAGEYVIVDDSGNKLNSVQVSKTANAKTSSDDTLVYEMIINRNYVTVGKGDYLEFLSGKAYKVGEDPAIKKNADGSLKAGQYKVGRDLDAGAYVIVDDAKNALNIMQVTLTPHASITSENNVCYHTMMYRRHVILEAGQYVSFDNGSLYAESAAPAVKKNADGSFAAGQYKVGKDVPAGTYTITPNDSFCTYRLTSKPNGYKSSEIVKQGNYFKDAQTVTLQDGQYIEFTNCTMSQA